MLLAAALVALAAAAPLPVADGRPADCERNRGWIPLAEIPHVVRQGERVPVAYTRTHGPDGRYPFSPQCLREWRISDSRVTMSDDRRTIIVPADIPAGTEIRISAAYDDSREVRIGFVVLGRDARTLAGSWSEVGRENCAGDRIAELLFSTSGRYSFTRPRDMVETMTSGAGHYRWDPATNVLEMGDGDRVHWRGKAVREGGALVIEGINLTGFQNGPDLPPCRITLRGG